MLPGRRVGSDLINDKSMINYFANSPQFAVDFGVNARWRIDKVC
jgi:hypothetical protein